MSPSIPVNRSIPEEINGTPNAKEVAAPPNSPNINKISTNLPKIYQFVLSVLDDKLD